MTEKMQRRTQARVADREQARVRQRRKSIMIKTIPLILGVIVVLFIVFVAFTTANTASPMTQGTVGARLQVDHEQIDLGHQVFNDTVRATFNIKNIGDGTLKLVAPKIATVLEGC